MGLSRSSTGPKILKTNKNNELNAKTVAIAGNPNVGKSTIFNALTGMHQHTGNWPGKTVANAVGSFKSEKSNYRLIDIPGTYSLLAHSPEEEIARNFICFSKYQKIIVVCDATCLERNLNLVLQILEITNNVIVCINLLDEAKRKGIEIDLDLLTKRLKVPVIGTVARNKKSLKRLISVLDKEEIKDEPSLPIRYPDIIEEAIKIILPKAAHLLNSKINPRWFSLMLLSDDPSLTKEITSHLGFNPLENKPLACALNEAHSLLLEQGVKQNRIIDMLASSAVVAAENICKGVIITKKSKYHLFDRKADKIVTSKSFGYPLMLLLLAGIFWLTISGANYISEILSAFFNYIEKLIGTFLGSIKTPPILCRIITEGIFRVPAWITAVMLPPMAIFFPLFTLLEDSGYLPRIAYNLDKPFKKCGSCGKQALTMCMGFGCNAAGVIGCRIIDSPRERLLGIITNSLVPCNGRFPTIIAMISMFLVGGATFLASIKSALLLTLAILISILVTFISTKILSQTLLKGKSSSYTLELPPFRKPQLLRVLVRSVFDRTLFVLGRSLSVALPAGIIIWLMANINIGDNSILTICADFLDPFATLLGLDGVILIAFILAFPANEIVIPIIIMAYLSTGSLSEISALSGLKEILVANGWTPLTAICTIIFSLFHWPCSTTLLTIKKETGSLKWSLVSVILPTLIGMVLCFIVKTLYSVLFMIG